MNIVLLAGRSGAGKTTLAKALKANGLGHHLSTSEFIRSVRQGTSESDDSLLREGFDLDRRDPGWLGRALGPYTSVVVDSVRSDCQVACLDGIANLVMVNVVAEAGDISRRLAGRGRGDLLGYSYHFQSPDVVWDSSRQPISTALTAVVRKLGGGFVDVVVGGQYGSEGKGKLASLIAPDYDLLLRSGGPNAGHWVRLRDRAYCFHHIPSGAMTNPTAGIMIGAGATVNVDDFLKEVSDTGVADRLKLDYRVMPISPADIREETSIVETVGSTGRGAGSAAARRVSRRYSTAGSWPPSLRGWTTSVSSELCDALHSGKNVLAEGTQGSALSLFHGNYPYVTSRDTNVSGLLSECGVPPWRLGEVWMVLRSFPIRVGGNSGPLPMESSWADVSANSGIPELALMNHERTSTTNRLRRVGMFDFAQLRSAVKLNGPTALFLSFADYIHPSAAGVREWRLLPTKVMKFVGELEDASGVPVGGISTGPFNDEVVWRGSFGPKEVGCGDKP